MDDAQTISRQLGRQIRRRRESGIYRPMATLRRRGKPWFPHPTGWQLARRGAVSAGRVLVVLCTSGEFRRLGSAGLTSQPITCVADIMFALYCWEKSPWRKSLGNTMHRGVRPPYCQRKESCGLRPLLRQCSGWKPLLRGCFRVVGPAALRSAGAGGCGGGLLRRRRRSRPDCRAPRLECRR